MPPDMTAQTSSPPPATATTVSPASPPPTPPPVPAYFATTAGAHRSLARCSAGTEDLNEEDALVKAEKIQRKWGRFSTKLPKRCSSKRMACHVLAQIFVILRGHLFKVFQLSSRAQSLWTGKEVPTVCGALFESLLHDAHGYLLRTPSMLDAWPEWAKSRMRGAAVPKFGAQKTSTNETIDFWEEDYFHWGESRG
ncbi:hypothetical protein MMC07_006452 [Pseudocyphellaria aurata]|nr:hypothetical protein [Pseudocyphellaria aurata]